MFGATERHNLFPMLMVCCPLLDASCSRTCSLWRTGGIPGPCMGAGAYRASPSPPPYDPLNHPLEELSRFLELHDHQDDEKYSTAGDK